MPDPVGRSLVTNTTPLIALTAATGGLDVMRFLFDRVVAPLEVAEERSSAIQAGMKALERTLR